MTQGVQNRDLSHGRGRLVVVRRDRATTEGGEQPA